MCVGVVSGDWMCEVESKKNLSFFAKCTVDEASIQLRYRGNTYPLPTCMQYTTRHPIHATDL
jgi:hypothetical protein